MNIFYSMKTRFRGPVLFLLFFFPLAGFAQDQPLQKTDSTERYSHWYVGAEYGLPFLFGDFTSFSTDKTYIGYQYGGFAGYQLNSWVGLELSARAGAAKMGAKSYATDYLLNGEGMTYYVQQSFPTWKYNDVYSKVRFVNLGFQMNLNVNNFFSENTGNRRWTVLLSPAVYAQHFSPELFVKEDGKELSGSGSGKWNFGAGGDISLRYKASRLFDVQLRTGISWVNNHKMDGVSTLINSKDHFMSSAGISFIWKTGKKGTKDNVLYATSRKCPEVMPVPEEVVVPQPVSAVPDSGYRKYPEVVTCLERKIDSLDRLLQQKTKSEQAVAEPSRTPVLGFNELPPVYFKRGSSVLDANLYRNELKRIVQTLEKYPELKIVAKGYADHTGNQVINQKISLRRAKSLAGYLEKAGISANRIETQGESTDTLTSEPNNYSILARRVIIEIQK